MQLEPSKAIYVPLVVIGREAATLRGATYSRSRFSQRHGSAKMTRRYSFHERQGFRWEKDSLSHAAPGIAMDANGLVYLSLSHRDQLVIVLTRTRRCNSNNSNNNNNKAFEAAISFTRLGDSRGGGREHTRNAATALRYQHSFCLPHLASSRIRAAV